MYSNWLLLLVFILLPLLSHSALTWRRLDDPQAICNDYSRAGYFIETIPGSNAWIIFLESGGLCYSPDTCNRRFFRTSIRREFATSYSSIGDSLFPQFNYTTAWLETANRPLDQRINIYMTSMETYYMQEGDEEITIEGKDLLDSNPLLNPLFHNYNKVLVPYCSSDLWIGNDTRTLHSFSNNNSDNLQAEFLSSIYNPEATSLQFTFRGKVILRSIIDELIDEKDFLAASDVILAGSSGGGLGAVNSAKWIREILPVDTSLSIIADSSWFINFRDNIYRRVNGTLVVSDSLTSSSDPNSLLSILESSPECLDVSHGAPCCMLMECMLTKHQFFPVDSVPVVALFSLYDVYLLADAIASLNLLGGEDVTSIQPDLGLDFIFTVAEYGGAMNSSINRLRISSPSVTVIVTECLQHIYLATSSLWETGGLFQEDNLEQLDIDVGAYSGSFRHAIRSGVWSSYYFSGIPEQEKDLTNHSCDISQALTIRDALQIWKDCRFTTTRPRPLSFRDKCYSIRCNDLCPDRLDFTVDVTLLSYPLWAKIVIAVLVVIITTVSILIKLSFWIWQLLLEHKLSLYLHQLKHYTHLDNNKQIDSTFPSLDIKEAMSISCLDIVYGVSYRRKKKKLKSKQEDITALTSSDATNFKKNRTNSTNMMQGEEIESGNDNKFSIDQLKPPKPLLYAAQEMDSGIREDLLCGKIHKTILKGVTAYFNPGELVAIMGPSGSGKTTFLDLLTGRRNVGKLEGGIYVNGAPINTVRDQYISETGYVLQLAAPFYEELTVRENLTFSAHLKLPNSMTWRKKFERVEQVMNITGLDSMGDTVVGGVSGPGLSGGQKKRLAIALQLLTMPKIIFLDEPTSGLDATASIELLTHLNALAATNRTVILTIHQPRFEIFYMFDRLMLLTDGKIAYNGVPMKAYSFFVDALLEKCFAHGKTSVKLEDQNPADVLMDMLSRPWMRAIILERYERSKEPGRVKYAVKKAIVKEFSDTQETKPVFTKRSERQAGLFSRLAVHEAIARKRSKLIWKFYLTVFFLAYGILLGTVYFQQNSGLLIVSGYCVYSVASALFMFPILQNYFLKTLDVYKYEKADGVGSPFDLVTQGYFRFVTIALIPVIFCALVLYLLLVNMDHWNGYVFLELVVVGMALNQTWIALLIFIINAFPSYAYRISPIVSSVAGFSTGFFIPREATPWIYRWIFYINPNYYGFSASAHLILSDLEVDCSLGASPIQCYFQSGDYVLKLYSFEYVKPYQHVAILLLMTVIYYLLAVFANWLRYTNFFKKLKSKIKHFVKKKDMKQMTEEVKEVETQHKSAKIKWAKLASKAVGGQSSNDYELNEKRNYFDTLLGSDDDEHVVFKPGVQSEGRLAQLVSNLVREQRSADGFKSKLKERQMKIEEHVKTTKEVVKEQVIGNTISSIDEQTEQEQSSALTNKSSMVVEKSPPIIPDNEIPKPTDEQTEPPILIDKSLLIMEESSTVIIDESWPPVVDDEPPTVVDEPPTVVDEQAKSPNFINNVIEESPPVATLIDGQAIKQNIPTEQDASPTQLHPTVIDKPEDDDHIVVIAPPVEFAALPTQAHDVSDEVMEERITEINED